ncbi:nucleotidyltransferase domain-containing protein [Breoghania sp. JC706]|uniref:nucleotidyltransferase domain-containing protein n=1 Tax=Breoghania sp. JC706 TaxID=3117732 RepID=UPI00300BD067
MPDHQTAFLSARVPVPLKNRFKALAARRGEKVQDLLNALVEDYVAREDKSPPLATDVLKALRAGRGELQEMGIAHLTLFGSVARGEARADSDIDIAYEFEPDARPSLFDIGRIETRIAAMLGGNHAIDFAPREDLYDHVRATSRDDEIRIF